MVPYKKACPSVLGLRTPFLQRPDPEDFLLWPGRAANIRCLAFYFKKQTSRDKLGVFCLFFLTLRQGLCRLVPAPTTLLLAPDFQPYSLPIPPASFCFIKDWEYFHYKSITEWKIHGYSQALKWKNVSCIEHILFKQSDPFQVLLQL